MPVMRIPFTVNASFDVYLRYDEGDPTDDLYDLLFEEYALDQTPPIYTDLVDHVFDDVPHTYDVETSVDYHEGIDLCPSVLPDGPVPHWREFVPKNVMNFMTTCALQEELQDAAEDGDYDRIIELALKLKALND